jgi:hypothetical protein
MISFDTIKFSLPNASEYFRVNSNDAFRELKEYYQGEERITRSLKDKTNTIGLSRVLHKASADILEIELSSKLLLDDYHRGISSNTFDRLIDSLDNEIFSLSGEWHSKAILHRADASTFIKPKNLDLTLTQLDILRLNKKVLVRRYPTIGKAQTISFEGKSARNKFYLSVYNKFDELNRRENRKFCELVGAKYVSQFIGKLRVETKLNKHSDIKQYLEVDNGELDNVVYLTDALSSKAKPIKKAFEYVVQPQASLFESDNFFMNSDVSLNHKESKYGRRGIIEKLEYDLDAITSYISMHLSQGTNKSKYIRLYKQEIGEMINEQKGKVEVIEEMRQLLEQVAI